MKISKIIMAGLIVITLTACGATTGGVAKSLTKQSMTKVMASNVIPAAIADTDYVPSNEKIVIDAKTMDCETLSDEMLQVKSTISSSYDVISGAEDSKLTERMASAGASSMASKALSKVPFGGMFAKSAIKSMTKSGRMKTEQAQADLQNAQIEYANLSGLYTGKNCGS